MLFLIELILIKCDFVWSWYRYIRVDIKGSYLRMSKSILSREVGKEDIFGRTDVRYKWKKIGKYVRFLGNSIVIFEE